MNKLPDYIVEKHLIPYITSEELFYKLRSLNSYYYNCARNTIVIHFPEEMMTTLKRIVEFNNKEDLIKNFDALTKQLFDQKKVLFILMIEMNLSLMVNKILEWSRDERVIELLAFLYVVTKNESKRKMLQEQKFDELMQTAKTPQSVQEMRERVTHSLNDDDTDYDINEYQTIFESLDHAFLRTNEFTGAMYNYIGIFIGYCHTKLRFSEMRVKIEEFFKHVQEASEVWPKKRRFYEKTIDLVGESVALSEVSKEMLKLMNKYEIEHPLSDYNGEKLFISEFDSEEEKIRKIKENRNNLNRKLMHIEKMSTFFKMSVAYCNKKICFVFEGEIFETGDFLFILSLIKPQYYINCASFNVTRNLINLGKEDINNDTEKVFKVGDGEEITCGCECEDYLRGAKYPNSLEEERYKTQLDCLQIHQDELMKKIEGIEQACKDLNNAQATLIGNGVPNINNILHNNVQNNNQNNIQNNNVGGNNGVIQNQVNLEIEGQNNPQGNQFNNPNNIQNIQEIQLDIHPVINNQNNIIQNQENMQIEANNVNTSENVPQNNVTNNPNPEQQSSPTDFDPNMPL